MIRSRYWILAILLPLVVAATTLHAQEPKRPAVKSKPSAKPKQYGHVVLEDVRLNAMGIHCTIKRIRLQYKGDGIDTGAIERFLAGCVEVSGESPASAVPAPQQYGAAPGGALVGAAFGSLASAAGKTPNLLPPLPDPEVKESAQLKRLAAEDNKKVKVVLWAHMDATQPSEELIHADRQLAAKLGEEIRRLSKENKEKVTVVKASEVEQYKSQHPNWKSFELAKVGHDLNADYVINLDIDKLRLYEPNTNRQLYRGQTEILVSVMDMKNSDDVLTREFNDRYPSEARGCMDTFDIPWQSFREKFLKHEAKRLARYFVDHQKQGRTRVAADE